MAKKTLNNNVSFGEQRNKINDNFTELYEGKVDKESGKGLVSDAEKATWNAKQNARNLKTINGQSIEGTGNIVIDASGNPWTERGEFENFGDLVIRKVTGYFGGVGTVPAELSANVGKYNAKTGGYTLVQDDATTWSGGASIDVTKFIKKEAGNGVNLVETSKIKPNLRPLADGTFTSLAGYDGYDLTAEQTGFYSVVGANNGGGYAAYIFEGNVLIKTYFFNVKVENFYVEKGQRILTSFSQLPNSGIYFRYSEKLSNGDIMNSEFNERLKIKSKNNYLNFIDDSKLVPNSWLSNAGGYNGHDASSCTTVLIYLPKGKYYKIGGQLAGSGNAIYNADGTYARGVSFAGNSFTISGTEAYGAFSFNTADVEKGIMNDRNTYLPFGTTEEKPSQTFSDLKIIPETTLEKLRFEGKPGQLSSSLYIVPMNTRFKNFKEGDNLTFTCKVKSLTAGVPNISFGYCLGVNGSITSQAGNANFDSITVAVVNGVDSNVSYSVVINASMEAEMNKTAELCFVVGRFDLANLNLWTVELSELKITNNSKNFIVNEFTGTSAKTILGGKFYKPTTSDLPSVMLQGREHTQLLKGKRLLAIGDSITEGINGNFYGEIQKITGVSVVNVGSSGADVSRLVKIVTGYEAYNSENYVDVNKQDPLQYDIAMIMLGTNGGVSGTEMNAYVANCFWDLPKTIDGVLYNTPEEFTMGKLTGSFLNGMSVLVQYLLFYNPKIKIYFVTPPLNIGNPTLAEDRMVQLKNFTTFYNVEMINAYKNTQMTKQNYLNYLKADGIHFNTYGNEVWGKYIGNHINRKM